MTEDLDDQSAMRAAFSELRRRGFKARMSLAGPYETYNGYKLPTNWDYTDPGPWVMFESDRDWLLDRNWKDYSIRSGITLMWAGTSSDGETIRSVLESYGLRVEWDGKPINWRLIHPNNDEMRHAIRVYGQG